MKTLIAILLLSITAAAQPAERLEAGVLWSGTFLRRIGSSDSGVGTSALGIGGRVVVHVLPHLDFESEATVWPNNAATSGTWIQALFGIKAGERFGRFGIFAKARPGFMVFRKDPFGATRPGNSFQFRQSAASSEPVFDAGGVLEYYTSRNLILRFDLGDMLVHYHRRDVFLSPSQTSVSRGGFTTENWQGGFGLGFRF